MIGDRYSTDVLFGNIHGMQLRVTNPPVSVRYTHLHPTTHTLRFFFIIKWHLFALAHPGLLTIRTDQFTHSGENVVNAQLQRIEKAVIRLLLRAGVTPPEHPLVKDPREVTK